MKNLHADQYRPSNIHAKYLRQPLREGKRGGGICRRGRVREISQEVRPQYSKAARVQVHMQVSRRSTSQISPEASRPPKGQERRDRGERERDRDSPLKRQASDCFQLGRFFLRFPVFHRKKKLCFVPGRRYSEEVGPRFGSWAAFLLTTSPPLFISPTQNSPLALRTVIVLREKLQDPWCTPTRPPPTAHQQ